MDRIRAREMVWLLSLMRPLRGKREEDIREYSRGKKDEVYLPQISTSFVWKDKAKEIVLLAESEKRKKRGVSQLTGEQHQFS